MKKAKGNQRTVFVTGAGGGIGKACVLELRENGFEVIAGVRKAADEIHLKEVFGKDVISVQMDVTNADSIRRAVESIMRKLENRGLYGLVNCAGIPMGGPLEFLSIDKFRRVLEVNLIGQLSIIQALIPLIRKAKGRIVNISSAAGIVSFPFVGAYAASKFGLEAITDALRIELHPWKIKVSIIEPGDVATPIWEKTSAILHKIMEESPPEALKLYGPVVKLIDKIKIHGIPPKKVADIATNALLSRKPRARYRVGRDVTMFMFLKHLPGLPPI